MSPPIRDGSGSSIGSIRLGDGSEISEVRTGAGDVLFSAIPDSVVDDFEDGDINEYTGNTGSFSVNSNAPVFEGTYSLKTTNNNEAIISTSGLPNYPAPGDKFQVRVHLGGDSDSGVSVRFAVQDGSNYYRLRVGQSNSRIRLEEQGGSGVLATDTSPDIAALNNEWLKIFCEWRVDGDTIVFKLFDSNDVEQGSVSANSTLHGAGGIGFSTGPSTGSPNIAIDEFLTT